MFLFYPVVDDVKLVVFRTVGQAEPYSLQGLAIPFGIGVKYSISQSVGLAFEWGMRKTFTDYIDDVSTNYPIINSAVNPNFRYDLSDPAGTHSGGEQRGNPKTMDWFNFAGVSITVEFDVFQKSTCVDFQYGNR